MEDKLPKICFACEEYQKCCSCGRGICKVSKTGVHDTFSCGNRDWKPKKIWNLWESEELKKLRKLVD